MNYYLAQACQNTFVLFDCLAASSLDPQVVKKVLQSLQREKRDDALILIGGMSQGDVLHAQMVVLGCDGSFGEFCGNGARACAAFLFARYPVLKRFFLKIPGGLSPLFSHGDGIYSVGLPKPHFTINAKFAAQPISPPFHYAEVIEPHLLYKANLSDEELLALGRELNRDKQRFPFGINVNAWQCIGENRLFVKTYERGVQRLTRSCGTGSLCCAAFYQPRGQVRVTTPGGELEIALSEESALLKGPACVFYAEKRAEEE